MNLRYLSAAALVLGLFAAQPVLAQTTDTSPKTSQTTHKKKHKSKKKTVTPTPATDSTKTQ